MDATTLATIAGATVTLILAILKMHSDLVNKTMPDQVDRIIAAGVQNNSKADDRHTSHLAAMKKVEKGLKKLKRKKCRKKSFQNGLPRHPEEPRQPKGRH